MEFPMPTEDSVNRAMLAAWRDHGELLLQHCDDCGAVIFYPRKRCPSCWSASLTNRASAGAGSIVTFSIVHRGVDEAFRREGHNVVLAVVKTDEGPQVITRIVGSVSACSFTLTAIANAIRCRCSRSPRKSTYRQHPLNVGSSLTRRAD